MEDRLLGGVVVVVVVVSHGVVEQGTRPRKNELRREREKQKIELIELVSHVVGPTVHFLEVVS